MDLLEAIRVAPTSAHVDAFFEALFLRAVGVVLGPLAPGNGSFVDVPLFPTILELILCR